MPDAFFAHSKKRKRTSESTSKAGPSSSSKKPRKELKTGGPSTSKNGPKNDRAGRKRDEELSSGGEDGGIDNMDLRAEFVDPNESGEDEEGLQETAGEKRLRLAKMYLENVKRTLGKCIMKFEA